MVDMTETRAPLPAWGLRVRSLLPLAALDFSVVVSNTDNRGFGWLAGVFLALVSLGWLAMSLTARPRAATIAAPLLMGAAGIGLSAVASPGVAITFPAIACLNASARNPLRRSVPFTVALAGVIAATQAAVHHGTTLILLGPSVCVAGMLVGLIRRQNAALNEETRLAQEGQARSAALDERARIAREIHDVLAHSLAALTVQLETADALLETGHTEQARHSVLRANQLAREGLAETRRAITALREDTHPLPDLLTNLTTTYHTDHHAPATIHIHGQPRDLNPDTTLTLYRTAQEAITNIRKHAPGAPTTLTLHYQPHTITLTITNTNPPPNTPRPLTTTGSGYGLTGLRERAELAGGTFTAGPITTNDTDTTAGGAGGTPPAVPGNGEGPAEPGNGEGPAGSGWRVDVRIPA
jgi:signal transduction histidine kinase